MSDPTALREAAQALVIFAGRFSAGDSDVQREDLQVAIDDLRDALEAAPPAAPSEDAAWEALLHEAGVVNWDHYEPVGAIIARHRPRIEAAIRAAAGDGGLGVERLAQAMDNTAQERMALIDWNQPEQPGLARVAATIIAREYARLAPAAAGDGGLDVERERVLECARRVVSMLFYVNVTNPEMRDLIEAQGALSAAKRRPAVYAAPAHTESATDGSGADD